MWKHRSGTSLARRTGFEGYKTAEGSGGEAAWSFKRRAGSLNHHSDDVSSNYHGFQPVDTICS
ncbi:hypothetical protein Ancab_034569 [Ancistrocladus abbreviatus]